MLRGRSGTLQAPPLCIMCRVHWNDSTVETAQHHRGFHGTQQTTLKCKTKKQQQVLQNDSFLTTGVFCACRRKEEFFWLHLSKADGNHLGIQLPLLLCCGTLNSDYKGTWGRAPVKMDSFFLEVSKTTISSQETCFGLASLLSTWLLNYFWDCDRLCFCSTVFLRQAVLRSVPVVASVNCEWTYHQCAQLFHISPAVFVVFVMLSRLPMVLYTCTGLVYRMQLQWEL